MSYLLDTNAVSAFMKGDPNFLERLRQVNRHEVRIPQPALAEISYGIARLPASARKKELSDRFDLVLSELAPCEWIDAVSDIFGMLKATLEHTGQRLEDFDLAIAAHAWVYEATLVTADLKHMQRIPRLRVEDWTQPATAGG